MKSSPNIARALDLRALLEQKSHFLFGPRQTGKTWLVHQQLRGAGVKVYDLLDSSVYLDLSQDPGRLGQELTARDRIVVIDEVQKLPILLDEVHRLIEARGVRFLLTGSSARKLRRGGVNLLGGRARTRRLHPLTFRELDHQFDLARALTHGTLPSIYFSEDATADLDAYAGTYLQQEIAAEGATRNVPAFSRFLRVAGACNGTIVNFTEVANDAQVPRTTVYEYFDILRDTLVLHEVPAWRETQVRKPIASSKYYFFDVGVVGAITGRVLRDGDADIGPAFETWIAHELLAYVDYVSGEPLHHWRSTSGFEVDFVLGDHTAIEVKAKTNPSTRDLRGLRALAEEDALRRYLCVSRVARPRRVGPVEVLPYQDFLRMLWDGAYA